MIDPTYLPVRLLENNVLHAFVNANPGAQRLLQHAIERQLFRPEVDYVTDGNRVTYPSINVNTRIMRVQETHFAMLWAATYGLTVLYEVGVHQAKVDGNFTGDIDLTNPLFHHAELAIQWACSLRIRFSVWPEWLVTPAAESAVDLENRHALLTNGIASDAMASLMWHEFAHLAMGHSNPTNDPAVQQQLEQEADDFAFHALVPQHATEDERVLKGWALVMPFLAHLLSLKHPSAMRSTRHGDVDVRLSHVLSRFHFAAQANRDYFYGLAAVAVTAAMRRWSIDLPDVPDQSMEEFFNACLDRLDEVLER
ncbi:ImmA/IrrE family metallo-endopeptidase [Tahibacter amnicola]|uniref:ImmA/IrrE family metallo-endopeptidase n=1 Tax=Tahibacter amnicola TaxID=2976241 RepID=A0ABY6BA69_9GAMM|nr:ImmA/IrrE family metallo-endopeptidase [Tahibacter amnicola]UXI66043.1 ImmA/IrrE family metallo-endopeptidase [Tahibacter amnicola]